MACGQLDKLEQTYPIITQPTEQVYQQTKNLYDINVKPAVDKVTLLTDKVRDVTNHSHLFSAILRKVCFDW